MTNDINKRLEILIEERLGTNKNQFSKKVKVASTQIYNIINGRNKPSYDLLLKIASTYKEVDLRWLLTGEESTNANAYTNTGDAVTDVVRAQLDALQERVSVIEKLLKLK